MNTRSKLLALLGAGLLTFGVVAAAVAAPETKVRICHATGANGNPYVDAKADRTADAGGHAGHVGPVWFDGITVAWGDIIPPFDIIGGGTFPGLNWDTDGQAIWNNNCNAPGAPVTNPPATDTPAPVVTGEPATDALGTTGSSGPTDTAWLLVVGLGVLLASIVVLTPARAKRQR
jgi:hypothetical protein